jgi:hypothetical protein
MKRNQSATAASGQKITFGQMREAGADGIEVFCTDHKCSHCVKMSADAWSDHMRLSDIEGQMVCQVCGRRGADVRPDYHGSQRLAASRR